MYISLSLYIYVYIYISIYTHTCIHTPCADAQGLGHGARAEPQRPLDLEADQHELRQGRSNCTILRNIIW